MTADPRAVKPRNLAVAPGELAIAWGDRHESYFPLERLRSECPCAECRTIRRHHGPRGPLRTSPEGSGPEIVALEPVGAYAVRIVWSDGHRGGIYRYAELRQRCPCTACEAARPSSR